MISVNRGSQAELAEVENLQQQQAFRLALRRNFPYPITISHFYYLNFFLFCEATNFFWGHYSMIEKLPKRSITVMCLLFHCRLAKRFITHYYNSRMPTIHELWFIHMLVCIPKGLCFQVRFNVHFRT